MLSCLTFFWAIASRFPGNLGTAIRLARIMEATHRRNDAVSFRTLMEKERATTAPRMIRILHHLVAAGLIERKYLLVSPYGGVIRPFADLGEIPDFAWDPVEKAVWRVLPEHIDLVYFHPARTLTPS